MFEPLTQTLPPARESSVACRLLDLLPLCPEADDTFELLLLSKLFFARTNITREQFQEAIAQRQRTGRSIEHFLVRDGHCDMTAALAVLAERRRIMRIIQQEPSSSDYETLD
ncbi:MAG TPA: hypothetical protein V6D05_10930 [Stenomitos sp.]